MNALLGSVGSDVILAIVVVFCRVGACLLLMPGISSARIPMRARLFVALAISVALMPILTPEARKIGMDVHPLLLFRLLAAETLIGLMIGLLARLFFLALETMATSIAFSIGLSSTLGAPIDESLPMPALSTLFTLTATMLIFATDTHWEMLRGLAASYGALPIGGGFDARFGLVQVADTLSASFMAALRISSPFLIYAVVVNLALGLMNRLIPQVPIYYISLPFVVGGGVVLLYFTVRQSLFVFTTLFSRWLAAA